MSHDEAGKPPSRQNQERQTHTLSLAGRPKVAPVTGDSQTRTPARLTNDLYKKGGIRWLSGTVTEQETRLDPVKSAPRQLITGRVSTYNAILPRATEHLKATGFGFEIPSTAVVTGIEAHIEKRRSQLGTVKDAQVRLVLNGAATGRNMALSGPWPSDGQITAYGSSTDLWDLTLTPQDVNNDNFGIAIAALLKPFDNFQTAEIGRIAITVYWKDTAQE